MQHVLSSDNQTPGKLEAIDDNGATDDNETTSGNDPTDHNETTSKYDDNWLGISNDNRTEDDTWLDAIDDNGEPGDSWLDATDENGATDFRKFRWYMIRLSLLSTRLNCTMKEN